jgi:hypothetical protein
MPDAPATTTDTTTTEQQPQTPPATVQPEPRANGKIIPIPQAALGKLKSEERAKGERRALAALDAEAKKLGFSDHKELSEYAAQQKRGTRTNGNGKATTQAKSEPTATAQPQGDAATVSRKDYDRLARENAELKQKLETASREKARADKLARETRRKLLDYQGVSELKLAAVKEGSKDPDYVVELLKRRMPTRNEGETSEAYYKRLETYDEAKEIASIRESHPHLFGEVTRPANTGNAGNIPAAKSPGAKPATPAPAADAGKRKDARDLTPDEFDKRLAEYGLNKPSVGSY